MSDLLDVRGDNPWRLRSSRVVYDNGRLRLREDAVVQPDGQPGSYTYLELPWPVVAIVPIGADHQVHLVRQWRYPWQRNSWEIPAGHGEQNESPLESARRELAEEVGIEAATWELMGSGFQNAAFNTRYYLYLARDLSPLASPLARDGAEQDLIARAVPMAEVIDAVMDGRIEHGITVIGILRAARRLGL
jgi:8-oxo-dGTP pyrophosphatase MutT (NUDIX family)